MKSRSWALIAVLLVAVAAGGTYVQRATAPSNDSGSRASYTTVDIEIVGGVGAGTVDTYVPDNFTVTEGEHVTLAVLNTDDNSHGLVITAFGVNSGIIDPGNTDRVSFLANQTGVFKFYEPPGYCQGGYGNICNSVQHMWGYMTVVPP